MSVFYDIVLAFYHLFIRIAALFNTKAKLWVIGRKGVFEKLSDEFAQKDDVAWFHCASLGEFEQGRPVMEKFKVDNPNSKILLTFFSPSGYEIRKNYELADCVCYLPRDSRKNAEKLLEFVCPRVVFFVKYEFWAHYINAIYQKGIPLYLISGVFREDHVFFKWYGGFFKNLLKGFSFFFLQNQLSKDILNKAGFDNCMVTGDTRFDRVNDTARTVKEISAIRTFKAKNSLFIAGSTWAADENVLLPYINEVNNDLKFIIAPHEIKEENIKRIKGNLKVETILFSEANDANISDAKVLIVDNIGMLSSLYQYGDIAYIGGAFGKNVHNVLEAAVFGMPVIFGPNYHKFKEAVDLVEIGGAFPIDSRNSFNKRMEFLLSDPYMIKMASEMSRSFVVKGQGATKKIIDRLTVL